MTTSHRPTFYSAIGGSSRSAVTSRQISAKDQIGFQTMKYRSVGQASKEEMEERDLKGELREKEKSYLSTHKEALLKLEYEEKAVDLDKIQLLIRDVAEDKDGGGKKYDDEDVEVNYEEDEDELASSDEEDDDDDDELELQRELDRIKEERAQQQAKRDAEEQASSEAHQRESAITGNPLIDIDGSGSAKLKRRWNDDVVFRNQTRGEPEVKKRFINDTIRNDFHRSFLKKFIN